MDRPLLLSLCGLPLLGFSGEATAGSSQVSLGGGLNVRLMDGKVRPGIELAMDYRYLFGELPGEDYWYYVETEPRFVGGVSLRAGWQLGRDVWGHVSATGGRAFSWCCGYPGGHVVLGGAELSAGLELGTVEGLGGVVSLAATTGSVEGWFEGADAVYALRQDVVIRRDSLAARLAFDLEEPLLTTDPGPIPPDVGRAYRSGARVLRPAVVPPPRVAPDAAPWIAQGRDELASVASFLRLAAELDALSAPQALLARAVRAAEEEAGHALACFHEAARRSGPLWVRPLRPRPRTFASRPAALWTHLAEALVDGVAGEGAAAVYAEQEASAAREDRTARIQGLIAREEAGHAALARDVAVWCARALVERRETARRPGHPSSQAHRR